MSTKQRLRKLERKAGTGEEQMVVLVDDEGCLSANIGGETYSGLEGETRDEFEERVTADFQNSPAVLWIDGKCAKL